MPTMFRLLWVLGMRTWTGFTRDACTQQAAAMAYYVLFSIVPLAIFLVSIAGLFLGSEENVEKIVDAIVDLIPGADPQLTGEGRESIENAIRSFQTASGPAAVISFVAAGWGATAMFSSVRRSLNMIWHTYEQRPYVIAKLIDIAQIGMIGVALLGSVLLTGLIRVARDLGVKYIGFLSDSWLWEIPGFLIPGVLATVTFAVLYRIVPTHRPPWRAVFWGAGAAAIMFQVLITGFSFYITNFNNFSVVYGSLAGVMIFLLFVYMCSLTLLIGGEIVRTFELYQKGALDAELAQEDTAI
jgi:membrane protein